MEAVGSFEAKTHLPKLLERVARGEKITITKHGKPVAMLAPRQRRTRRTWSRSSERCSSTATGRTGCSATSPYASSSRKVAATERGAAQLRRPARPRQFDRHRLVLRRREGRLRRWHRD